jgi:hypothetical protein
MSTRRLLPSLVLAASTAAILALLVQPACSNQCSKAEDCSRAGDVCYRNVCTPLSAMYVHCDTDKDCGMTGELVCAAQRCVFKGGGVVVNADASVSDSGPSDTAVADATSGTDAHQDATLPDATLPDAAMDAMTSTTADGSAGNG